MNKKLICLILSLCMLLPLLAGCHGSRGLREFAVPEEFDTNRDYEITFWAKNDTNKTQTQIYQNAIADFQALYPNIRVNLGSIPTMARYTTTSSPIFPPTPPQTSA